MEAAADCCASNFTKLARRPGSWIWVMAPQADVAATAEVMLLSVHQGPPVTTQPFAAEVRAAIDELQRANAAMPTTGPGSRRKIWNGCSSKLPMPDGVTPFSKEGQPVYQFNGIGGFSERAVIPAVAAVPLADEMPTASAALTLQSTSIGSETTLSARTSQPKAAPTAVNWPP